MPALEDYLNEISKETITAASKTAAENGWRPNDGDAKSLFGKLNRTLAELREAVGKGYLKPLPTYVRADLAEFVTNIQANLNEMAAGQDHTSNLQDSLERLNKTAWLAGLRATGGQALAIDATTVAVEDVAQLAQKATIGAENIRRSLEEVEESKASAASILNEIRAANETGNQLSEKSKETLGSLDEAMAALHVKLEQLSEIQAQTEDRANNVKARLDDATANEERIRQFTTRVDEDEKRLQTAITEAREAMNQTNANASATIQEMLDNAQGLKARLDEDEAKIGELLAGATAAGLFKAYGDRAKEIKPWPWAVAALGIAFVGVTTTYILLSGNNGKIGVDFFVRLGILLPTGILTAYFLRLYGQERRLQEEYKFKATSSLSLEPYRRLVADSTNDPSPESAQKYADFLIKSVETIFDPPTERVFGGEQKSTAKEIRTVTNGLSGLVEQIGNLIGKAKSG